MQARIAFALNHNNQFESKHFGDADKYCIYSWQDNELRFETEIINQSKNIDESSQHGSVVKGNSVINLLKNDEVNIVVSKQFGKNIRMVNKHFIPVLISTNTVEEASSIITANIELLMENLRNKPDEYKVFKGLHINTNNHGEKNDRENLSGFRG